MWMIVAGFGVTTLLLAWLMFGYVVWLRLAGDVRRYTRVAPPGASIHANLRVGNVPLPHGRGSEMAGRNAQNRVNRNTSRLPKISIVVPCMNEEELIVEKYHDLKRCDYPPEKLEIVFADGGSTDDTLPRLRELAEDDARVRVVCCPKGGKVAQLNHVLPALSGELVVVTDADARMAPDALSWIAAEFEADENVAVVGACTSPRGGLGIERCYWQAQNRIRFLESSVSHVSMVIACCYAFRRELLESFPEDVIADDVYITSLANASGYRTVYSANALVEELRTPLSLPEFFTHKFRKSNAVFRELLRFAYRLPEMDGSWRSILTTRIVQQILLPWGTLLWLLSAAALANLGQFDVLSLGVGLLLLGLLATRKATTAVNVPAGEERFSLLTLIQTYVYTMAILCATGLTYLHFKQNSCYSRLSGRKRSASRAAVEFGLPRGATSSSRVSSVPSLQMTVGASK